MINLPPKPVGSIIEVQQDFNQTILSWKNPSGGWWRYSTLLFLIPWMGGWAFGEVGALNQVLKGEASGFLIFWLIGWTAGGVFCATMIFRLARPARPEKLTLETLYLFYEPGTPAVVPFWKQDRQQNPFTMLRPKKSHKVGKKEIDEIRIDRVGERQRLSFDYGATRIEVGELLGEPEREWLFNVLKAWKSA